MHTILMAEDETPLRKLMTRLLTDAGFRVLPAADAEEALEIAAADTGPIDLLLTDVRMPGMDGIELYHELCRMRGDTPVLFISGYLDGRSLDRPFLAKPFKPSVLLARVRELVQGKAA